MKKKLFIIGDGQFAHFIKHLIGNDKNFIFGGFLVKKKVNSSYCEDAFLNKNKNKYIFPAVGNLKLRRKIINKIIKSNNLIPSIIHPSAKICQNVKIENCTLTYNSFISNDVKVGKYSVIGTGAYIHHNTRIGSNCIIGGGTHIGAGVTIGNNVLFGIGSSTASKKITIGNNSIIASGASILSDVPQNTLAIGNPARFIKF